MDAAIEHARLGPSAVIFEGGDQWLAFRRVEQILEVEMAMLDMEPGGRD